MRRTICSLILVAALASSVALVAQTAKPAAPPAEKTIAQLITAGEYQAAVDKGRPAVEAGTADFALFCNLGVAYFNLKDFPKAIEMYEKASVLNGSSTRPYEGLAAIYHEMGQDAQALEALDKAAVVDPSKSETLFNFAADAGIAFFEKGEYAKAEPLMRRAAQLKPEDMPSNLGLAQCLQNQKKYTDAVPFYQKVLALNTNEALKPAFLGKIAECQYFGKQFADAATTAEQILAIRPNEERALLFRAGSFLGLKDCAKAVPAVESFLAISKNNANRLLMLKGMAKCQYDLKQYKEAAATYEQAFAIDPNDEDVLLYAGNSYAQLKNNAKALVYFKKLAAVTKDPTLKASAQKNVKQMGG